MQQLYFKFDTGKRLDEIMNGIAVLSARQKELTDRLKRTDLSAIEYFEIAEELIKGFEQLQSYKEEVDEIAKIELLRNEMLGGEL